MADGKMRMENGGWKYADDKMRMEVHCGWKMANNYTRMIKSLLGEINLQCFLTVL